MSTTTNLGSTKPVSEQDAQKVVTYNTLADESDIGIAGYLSLSVAGSSNVTLTNKASGSPGTQALNKFLKLTGVLTGNISVIIPATGGFNRDYIIWNATSGAFTLGVKVGSGTALLISQGRARRIFHDGTTVYGEPEFDPSVTTGARTAYTPTLTAGTGSFTSAAAVGDYSQIGKEVAGSVTVTITTNGTAAGYVGVTLPVTAKNSNTIGCSGQEQGLTGKALAIVQQTTTQLRIRLYDASYPFTDGSVLIINFRYEAA